jgi:hypothetical protein
MVFKISAFLLALTLAACSGSDGKASVAGKADAICQCWQPIHEFELASQEAMKSRDSEKLEYLSTTYPKIKMIEEDCLSRWEKISRELSESEQTQLLDILKTQCFDTSLRVMSVD